MKLLDLRLVCSDHRAAVGLDEAGHKLLNLALDVLKFARGVSYLLLSVCLALLPKMRYR